MSKSIAVRTLSTKIFSATPYSNESSFIWLNFVPTRQLAHRLKHTNMHKNMHIIKICIYWYAQSCFVHNVVSFTLKLKLALMIFLICHSQSYTGHATEVFSLLAVPCGRCGQTNGDTGDSSDGDSDVNGSYFFSAAVGDRLVNAWWVAVSNRHRQTLPPA